MILKGRHTIDTGTVKITLVVVYKNQRFTGEKCPRCQTGNVFTHQKPG